MAQYISKALLAVDVPHRHSYQRRRKKETAVESGYSSVRVSKKTLAGLRRVARELGDVAGWRGRYSWRGGDVPLSELLEWIGTAVVLNPDRELVTACTAAIAQKHAKRVDGKSMHRTRPPAVHAKHPAGDDQ